MTAPRIPLASVEAYQAHHSKARILAWIEGKEAVA